MYYHSFDYIFASVVSTIKLRHVPVNGYTKSRLLGEMCRGTDHHLYDNKTDLQSNRNGQRRMIVKEERGGG